jgi:hypothetical protein
MEIGQKRGKLTILDIVGKERVQSQNRKDHFYYKKTYLCMCDCGAKVLKSSNNFMRAKWLNCGDFPCRELIKKEMVIEKEKAESFEEFRKRIKKDREKNSASGWIDLFQF